jgi:DNA-binding response OmpR family regulator
VREKPVILIVDDNPDILFATARVLTGGGYEVLQSQSGRESLTIIKENRPDLVLLDVNIPDMSGLEVCNRIKSDPELSRTFVAMISGTRASSDDQSDGLDIGADGYIIPSRNQMISNLRSQFYGYDPKAV